MVSVARKLIESGLSAGQTAKQHDMGSVSGNRKFPRES